MLLDIEILPPGKQHGSKLNSPDTLLQITGSGTLRVNEGAKVTCLISHGYCSEEYPTGRFFVICQLRSLFSQKFIEMFITDKAVPEEPLAHANCSYGHEMIIKAKSSGTITQIIISALHRLQEFICSKYNEDLELNLTSFLKFWSCLFEEHTNSIKVGLSTLILLLALLLLFSFM